MDSFLHLLPKNQLFAPKQRRQKFVMRRAGACYVYKANMSDEQCIMYAQCLCLPRLPHGVVQTLKAIEREALCKTPAFVPRGGDPRAI